MNRIVPLARTPLVSLWRFDHPEGVPHHDPPEERAGRHAINFVEAGGYEFRDGQAWQPVDSGRFTSWLPGMTYRVRHAHAMPQDVSLSLEYNDGFAEDVAGTAGRALPPRRVLSLDNRLAYLRLLLQRTAAEPEAMAVETLAGDIFGAVATYDDRPARRNFGARQLAWYTDRMQAVRELLDTHYEEAHTLSALGRQVGMSPYHLAHVFRELVGVAPHRYLLESRLRWAAARLRDGESVTDTCFAVGFANLSHFIRLFRRRYGATPSQYARA